MVIRHGINNHKIRIHLFVLQLGKYDKQPWEQSSEQRILQEIDQQYLNEGKTNTGLIDVDIVRSSVYVKTKPRHGWMAAFRWGLVRVAFAPFYWNYWYRHTGTCITVFIMVHFVLQLTQVISFLLTDPQSTKSSQDDVLLPCLLAICLGILHAHITAPHGAPAQSYLNSLLADCYCTTHMSKKSGKYAPHNQNLKCHHSDNCHNRKFIVCDNKPYYTAPNIIKSSDPSFDEANSLQMKLNCNRFTDHTQLIKFADLNHEELNNHLNSCLLSDHDLGKDMDYYSFHPNGVHSSRLKSLIRKRKHRTNSPGSGVRTKGHDADIDENEKFEANVKYNQQLKDRDVFVSNTDSSASSKEIESIITEKEKNYNLHIYKRLLQKISLNEKQIKFPNRFVNEKWDSDPNFNRISNVINSKRSMSMPTFPFKRLNLSIYHNDLSQSSSRLELSKSNINNVIKYGNCLHKSSPFPYYVHTSSSFKPNASSYSDTDEANVHANRSKTFISATAITALPHPINNNQQHVNNNLRRKVKFGSGKNLEFESVRGIGAELEANPKCTEDGLTDFKKLYTSLSEDNKKFVNNSNPDFKQIYNSGHDSGDAQSRKFDESLMHLEGTQFNSNLDKYNGTHDIYHSTSGPNLCLSQLTNKLNCDVQQLKVACDNDRIGLENTATVNNRLCAKSGQLIQPHINNQTIHSELTVPNSAASNKIVSDIIITDSNINIIDESKNRNMNSNNKTFSIFNDNEFYGHQCLKTKGNPNDRVINLGVNKLKDNSYIHKYGRKTNRSKKNRSRGQTASETEYDRINSDLGSDAYSSSGPDEWNSHQVADQKFVVNKKQIQPECLIAREQFIQPASHIIDDWKLLYGQMYPQPTSFNVPAIVMQYEADEADDGNGCCTEQKEQKTRIENHERKIKRKKCRFHSSFLPPTRNCSSGSGSDSDEEKKIAQSYFYNDKISQISYSYSHNSSSSDDGGGVGASNSGFKCEHLDKTRTMLDRANDKIDDTHAGCVMSDLKCKISDHTMNHNNSNNKCGKHNNISNSNNNNNNTVHLKTNSEPLINDHTTNQYEANDDGISGMKRVLKNDDGVENTKFKHSQSRFSEKSLKSSTVDTVRCYMWSGDKMSKFNLTMLDIGKNVIHAVERQSVSSDYFFIGCVVTILLPLLSVIFHAQSCIGPSVAHSSYCSTSQNPASNITKHFDLITNKEPTDNHHHFIDNFTNSDDHRSHVSSGFSFWHSILGLYLVAFIKIFYYLLDLVVNYFHDTFTICTKYSNGNYTSIWSVLSGQVFLDWLYGPDLPGRLVMILGFILRLNVYGSTFFFLCIAERTFQQRLLYAKYFFSLTSSRRALKYRVPQFRLNKISHIKCWLMLRSYLKKRGPQRSVENIVAASFYVAFTFGLTLSAQFLSKKRSNVFLQLSNWDIFGLTLGIVIFLHRFIWLGTKITKKYRNFSVLITEQINLYLSMEKKPYKKEDLMLTFQVLRLVESLLKEVDGPFRVCGWTLNPLVYNVFKLVLLSSFSTLLSESLGFKLKLYKLKLNPSNW